MCIDSVLVDTHSNFYVWYQYKSINILLHTVALTVQHHILLVTKHNTFGLDSMDMEWKYAGTVKNVCHFLLVAIL